ncbi:uncharacterized protein LOC133713877 [Rosa rugosa]|uniref:uncharacterized protein LOC133713877 n=1 Tax=Rosa rugosa TaxID=74645 RepID=UPI002B41409F|nr:uncharacterized protein LOC133713877 [Rosa rugosa]
MWHQSYEVCSICSMVGHSTETCPSIQYQGYYDQNTMLGGFQDNQGHWNNYYSPPYNPAWDNSPYSSWNNNPNMQQGSFNAFDASICSYHDYRPQSPPPQNSGMSNNYDEMIKALNAATQAVIQEQQALDASIQQARENDDDWAETQRRWEIFISQEHPSTLMVTLEEFPTTMALDQPHDAFNDSSYAEDEIRDLDESYEEQRNVETCEDYELCCITELEKWEMEDPFDDDDGSFHGGSKDELHANVSQVPETIMLHHEDPKCYVTTMENCLKGESVKASTFGPLLLAHGRQHDSSTPHSSSTHFLPIQEKFEFVDHVEMVIREHVKSDKEVILAVIVKLNKRWRQWKRRQEKRSIKSYLPIAPKLPKLLERDHEISLKKLKHLIEPQPKPPDYA